MFDGPTVCSAHLRYWCMFYMFALKCAELCLFYACLLGRLLSISLSGFNVPNKLNDLCIKYLYRQLKPSLHLPFHFSFLFCQINFFNNLSLNLHINKCKYWRPHLWFRLDIFPPYSAVCCTKKNQLYQCIHAQGWFCMTSKC